MMPAMQMPMPNMTNMNMPAMSPMMNMGMPLMMATMSCELQEECMLCTLTPAAGMEMSMFSHCGEMMGLMMNCGMPMMMNCGNLNLCAYPASCMSMMPMMGMMSPMMCMLEMSMGSGTMMCKLMPMPGMSMEMFKNVGMLMMKMMDSGMPMMMSCQGMPLMCCTC